MNIDVCIRTKTRCEACLLALKKFHCKALVLQELWLIVFYGEWLLPGMVIPEWWLSAEEASEEVACFRWWVLCAFNVSISSEWIFGARGTFSVFLAVSAGLVYPSFFYVVSNDCHNTQNHSVRNFSIPVSDPNKLLHCQFEKGFFILELNTQPRSFCAE